MEQITNGKDLSDTTELTSLIAEEKLNLALRNIDRNLHELTDKLKKPAEQARYVANNWREWRNQAAIVAAVAVAGIIIVRRIMK